MRPINKKYTGVKKSHNTLRNNMGKLVATRSWQQSFAIYKLKTIICLYRITVPNLEADISCSFLRLCQNQPQNAELNFMAMNPPPNQLRILI